MKHESRHNPPAKIVQHRPWTPEDPEVTRAAMREHKARLFGAARRARDRGDWTSYDSIVSAIRGCYDD